ncbi:9252_t:CDS:2 [Racocetra fulgida]|uniref:9252_t:CDS:1 n=1 Tax=Racocetra fulgida TaxID=60492 RepID=A0A9N9GH96_9GLOM|nr:9252_t:CDS:2 [Racocetra fulgida]
MPVIMENESDYLAKWLDPNIHWDSELEKLLEPYDGDYPVSQDVGNASNDDPSLINPVKRADITNFFPVKNDESKDANISSSKQMVKQDDGDDVKGSTSIISIIPVRRPLDESKNNIERDEFLLNEESHLKRLCALPHSLPAENLSNNGASSTEQLQTSLPNTISRKKSTLNFIVQKPKSLDMKNTTKTTNVFPPKDKFFKKKPKAKNKADGTAKITNYFLK